MACISFLSFIDLRTSSEASLFPKSFAWGRNVSRSSSFLTCNGKTYRFMPFTTVLHDITQKHSNNRWLMSNCPETLRNSKTLYHSYY